MVTSLRFAWRQIGVSSGTRLVIALLGVAVGATAALLTIVDAIVLHPLAVRDQNPLVHLGGLAEPPVGDAVAWWSQSEALDRLANYSSGEVDFEGEGAATLAKATVVSPDFFSVFGEQPSLGRSFALEDEQTEARVVVLSSEFWRRHFGHRESILGATVRVGGVAHAVVGVAPRGFDFPGATQLWVPRGRSARQLLLSESSDGGAELFRRSGWVGRLHAGTTSTQAENELSVLLGRLHHTYTATTGIHFGDTLSVRPLSTIVGERVRAPLGTLLAGAALVLCIATANCGTFLLGRAAARRGEMAIRQALGATPTLLIAQLLIEHMLFALVVGLVGLVVALSSLSIAGKVFSRYLVHVPPLSSVALTATSAVVVLAMAATAVAGLTPIVESISPRALLSLRDRGTVVWGARGAFLRKILVVGEVALALVLTNSAILAMQTFQSLTRLELGFEPKGALIAQVSFPPIRALGQERLLARQGDILAAVRAVPSLAAVGVTSVLPTSMASTGGVWIEVADIRAFCGSVLVGGDYFRAMGMPLIAGRDFSSDHSEALIVSEPAGLLPWSAKALVGREARIDGEDLARTIVGVVRGTRSPDDADEPQFQCYLPYAQPYRGSLTTSSTWVVARCAGGCEGAVPRFTHELRRASSEGSVRRVDAMSTLVSSALAPATARALLLGVYALLALSVAGAGVYALVSYLGELRTFEIGVRASLGAGPADNAWLIAGEGGVLAASGVILGTLASVGARRILESVFLGVSPLSPTTLTMSAMVLLVGACTASFVPAVRAARRSPWEMLQRGP